MATLKYVIGVPKDGSSSAEIDGADMYRLYTCDSATAPSVLDPSRRIAVQSTTLGFPFSGAIVDTGKEKEQTRNLLYLYDQSLGYGNVVSGKPLRKITESGAKYYFAVTTKATIVYKDGYMVTSTFSGEYYVDDDKKDESFSLHGYSNAANAFSGSPTEGWKMFLQLGYFDSDRRETVYKDVSIPLQAPNANIKSIGWGKGQSQSVTIIAREDDDTRCHSEYIPLEALGDGLSVTGADGTDAEVCVGEFELKTDDYDYPKMAFYNKNLKFVGGANSTKLFESMTGGNNTNDYVVTRQVTNDKNEVVNIVVYYSKQGVINIGEKVSGVVDKTSGVADKTHENYPAFVIFSSRQDNALKDKISVTRAYFPLFAMNDILPPKTGNAPYYLFATADSSHPELFTESVASNVETYTPPTA